MYETIPSAQKLPALKVKRAKSAAFTVQLQNDGSALDRFTVHGCPVTKGFTVTYKVSGADVTAAVAAGTYATAAMNPDDVATLDMTVVVSKKAKLNVVKVCGVTLTSVSDGAKLDAVAVQVKAG